MVSLISLSYQLGLGAQDIPKKSHNNHSARWLSMHRKLRKKQLRLWLHCFCK